MNHFPFPFLTLNSQIYSSLLSLKFMASFVVNYCYINYVTRIHTYSYTHKNTLLSPYDVSCIYLFRADNLVLGNQLTRSFLEKTISPALSLSLLPVVTCSGLSPSEPCPFLHVYCCCPCSAHFEIYRCISWHYWETQTPSNDALVLIVFVSLFQSVH